MQLGKQRISTAIQSKPNKFDMSCVHITTGGFFQFQPVYIQELVPKSKIEISSDIFSRLVPMADPAFVNSKIHLRHFFVPFRTCWNKWNSFLTESKVYDGSTVSHLSTVPVIDNSVIAQLICGDSHFSTTVPASSDDYDFIASSIENATNQRVFYRKKLTFKGRRVVKLLNSLGYHPIWTYAPTSVDYTPETEVRYSALPLLAVLRIYLDWYFNSRYTDSSSDYQKLLSMLTDRVSYSFTLADFISVIGFIEFVYYGDDYFVSSFDSPVSPSGGSYHNIQDIEVYPNSNSSRSIVNDFSTGQLHTPAILNDAQPATGSINVISQFLLNSLHALTDFVKRNNLIGSKIIDRYLAHYGVKLPNDKLDMSYLLDSQEIQIQIGDVVSTADTSTGSLGDYAGKGVASGQNDKVTFETDEFGYYIIIMSIVPRIGYYQGNNRNVFRTDRLSFFTPEFDALGMQPVSASELYVPNSLQNFAHADALRDNIFGWLPRYADYKVAPDKLTGDFSLRTVVDGNDWHTFRDFNGSYTDANTIKHSLSFTSSADGGQFNRLFLSTLEDDKFRVYLDFNVTLYQPMKFLFDHYEFHDGGDVVTSNPGGTRVN